MSESLKEKLAQLKDLHDSGLLTDQEFSEQKAAVLTTTLGTTPAIPRAPDPLAGATTIGTPSDPLAGATTADQMSALPKRLGNYGIKGIIGTGGMGVVLRARHEEEDWAGQQGGDVAIKLIHPHIASDSDFRKRFFAEAALGKRFNHPSLVSVYDVLSEGAWLGVVMELVEGKELSASVVKGGVSLEHALELLKPLAAGLDHLHDGGVVHRDLKPANIIIRSDGRPVILDLGIAKDTTSEAPEMTKTMTAMGTSLWMAPEQADAKTVTRAADVYAFGAITYALLSGCLPWPEGESELRILTNKMIGKLEPLSKVSHIGQRVSDVVMLALSVDVAKRPSSCGEFVERLANDKQTRGAKKEEFRKVSETSNAQVKEVLRPVIAQRSLQDLLDKYIRSDDPVWVKKRDWFWKMMLVPAVLFLFWAGLRNSSPPEVNVPAQTALNVANLVVDSQKSGPSMTAAVSTLNSPSESVSEFNAVISTIKDGGYVSDTSLMALSCHELWVARNWIYGRHGYAFTTPKAQKYYGDQKGYSRKIQVKKSTVLRYLNTADKANRNKLTEMEKLNGCSKP
jgi:serine/threonine protein kinase